MSMSHGSRSSSSIEFLGTGTSTGVPVIGCDCDVCHSTDPRDQRLRSSVMLTVDDTHILVDTAPDLRQQMLRSGHRRIDGILFTHIHADHTAGMDEIRSFNAIQQDWIPAFAPDNAIADLKKRFGYAFVREFPYFGVSPDLTLTPVVGTASFELAGVHVQPIPVMHGRLPILGYRIGNIAYLTDVKILPDESWPLLENLDILVMTALRRNEHPAHLNLDGALATIDRIQPRRAILSHVGHELGRYADVERELPRHVTLGYDGLIAHASG